MDRPGYRILERTEGLSAVRRKQFENVPLAALSDCMGRSFGTTNLRPLHGTRALLGNAVTVKTRPGDNLLIHKAFDCVRPGDVLVIDGGGALQNALVGELMMLMAIERGMAGFVVDGAIRDVSAFREADFPCYARGVTHRGPYKDGPGEINTAISVDGMAVFPGDLIVGDADGLLAIRPDDAEQVLAAATSHLKKEADFRIAIRSHSQDRDWIATALQRLEGNR